MKISIQGTTAKQPRERIGDVRRSQVIATFGPGALLKLPYGPVIIDGTRFWERTLDSESDRLDEPNLERLLHVDHFCAPPVNEDEETEIYKGVLPASRFPAWYFCPSCGRLGRFYRIGKKKKGQLHCVHCDAVLIPSRFLIACINGHLEDFPYMWWVHRGATPKDGERHELSVCFSGKSGGLEDTVITCSCGAKRSMSGCMNQAALQGFRCYGHRPWLPGAGEERCVAVPRTLLSSSSSVYYSVVASALTLPHAMDEICAVLSKKREDMEALVDAPNILQRFLPKWFAKLPECPSLDTVLRVWETMQAGASNFEEADLFLDEYRILSRGTMEDDGHHQYQAEEVDVPASLQPIACQVVKVSRLREVLALRGFRRIYPEPPDAETAKKDLRFKGWNGKPYVPLSDRPLDWLPAVEMLGEGMFLRFREEVIAAWEQRVAHRYTKLYEKAGIEIMGKDVAKGRYIFLHTFAHLLIRQLTLMCGYSGASLKERIYTDFEGRSAEEAMCGVLIYTATSDSDGSLGGLVQMAEPEQLDVLVREMVREASWCSSDPVCLESSGQGFKGANYAACHACTLLPETSCEARNVYLDRVSVIGTLSDRSMGLLSYLMDAG